MPRAADAAARSRTLDVLSLAPAVALLALALCGCTPVVARPASSTPGETVASAATDDVLARAFATRASGLEVQGRGTVTRLLGDDSDGARHQRFVIMLESGQTLLVAHNVDVAPRIPALQVGDVVSFKGEYEWNPQGGVIHWTHRDPAGSHEPGWVEYAGRLYR